MRKTLLATLAAATMLSIGLLATGVAAKSTAAPSTQGIEKGAAASFREAAVMCGNNGCAPVQTKPPATRKFKPLGHG